MFFSDLIHLFFPDKCAACNTPLFDNEKEICMECFYKMPETDYHKELNNEVEKVFMGRISINGATSLYNFKKAGKVRNVLHELKYNGNKNIGVRLGYILGSRIKEAERFNSAEVVIPVPLHSKKRKKRGYNQSELIAKGVSEAMNITLITNLLIRNEFTNTQTQKGRIERWENVSEVFSLTKKNPYSHVIIVDDVLTTGATMESCIATLITNEEVKVSVATLAFAE